MASWRDEHNLVMSIMEDTAYATKCHLSLHAPSLAAPSLPLLSGSMAYLSSLLALITIYTGYVYCQLTLLEPGGDAFNIVGTTSPFEEVGVSDDGLTTTYIRNLGDNAFETLIVSASGFVELKSQEPSGATVTGTKSIGCDLVGTTLVLCQDGAFTTIGTPFAVVLSAETFTTSPSSSSSNPHITTTQSPTPLPTSAFTSTSSSTIGPTSSSSTSSGSALKPSELAGIVVGVVAVLFLILILYWLIQRRRKRQIKEIGVFPFNGVSDFPNNNKFDTPMGSLSTTTYGFPQSSIPSTLGGLSRNLETTEQERAMGAQGFWVPQGSSVTKASSEVSSSQAGTVQPSAVAEILERVRRLEEQVVDQPPQYDA
ncbi:hypothetical protein BT96DRAFT_972268 [Gymnopus androsaceus JB14]|uniref:Mid2 domain-containing protein n=1 Tax=Gymnopus androsaceus JB14 TaxID=1447944 RepID=A0A6A4I5L1_9AGAR|nr:hypothetical protein BT96DRAFT_972268 [Gymnopus androsaceus JB14]